MITIVIAGCSTSSFIDTDLYEAAKPIVGFQSTVLPVSTPDNSNTADRFDRQAAAMLIRRRQYGFYDNPLVLMNYLYAIQNEIDQYADRGYGIRAHFSAGLEGFIEMKKYFESSFAHTQHRNEFVRLPGNDPWGRGQGNVIPEYKKLLPSETIAMSMYTERITGKCTTLSSLLGGILIATDSSISENVVFLRKKGHTFGLAKTEEGRVLVFNNTHLNQIGPPYLEFLTSEDYTHFFGFGFYAKCNVVIPQDLLTGKDTLRTMFELSSGVQASDYDLDPILVAYTQQKLYVPDPFMYVEVSAKLPHTRQIANQLKTVEEVVDWMLQTLSDGSIFPDPDVRVMTSDEVIVFKTGTPLDKAILLYAVLLNHGQQPAFDIIDNHIVIRTDDKIIDMHELTIGNGK